MYKPKLIPCLINILLSVLFLGNAVADEGCITKDDLDRVAFKNGYAHDFMQMARDYFKENGECPSPYWLSRQIKLHVQHPEMFGGQALKIYEMETSSGGVPEDMTPEERDGYIFYYGGPSGVVSIEIFDSATGIHYSSITTDSDNMAQAAEAAEHHVFHMFTMFAQELEDDGQVEDLIEKYTRDLAFGPNEEARRHLISAFRRGLRNFAHEVVSGNYNARPYAYELGRLRAAVWDEYRDIRDMNMYRNLKYGY